MRLKYLESEDLFTSNGFFKIQKILNGKNVTYFALNFARTLFMVHELSPIRIYAYDMRHIPNMITDGKISPNTFISIYIIESNTSKSVNFKRHSVIQLICSNITAKRAFQIEDLGSEAANH